MEPIPDRFIIKGDRLYRGGKFFAGWFQVSGGRITRWGSKKSKRPRGGLILDAEDNPVIPGLVDQHVHGYGGIDATDGSIQKLRELDLHLASKGTTSFLATLYPTSMIRMKRQLQAVHAAGILGAHFEGPFLNPKRRGALNARHFLFPDRRLLRALITFGQGTLRKMTIAPELPGARDCIRLMRDNGVTASMGHSDAKFDEARKAAEVGAKSVTHLFNAMRPLHHREPGLAGYALRDQEISCELIGDLAHVSQPVVEWLLETKNMLYIVSDCLPGAGQKKKTFTAGGKKHVIKGGTAFIAGKKTLSGSAMTLLEMVRRLLSRKIMSLEEAVFLASTAPAQELGAEEKGDLEKGCDADIVVLNRRLQPAKVFRRGVEVPLKS